MCGLPRPVCFTCLGWIGERPHRSGVCVWPSQVVVSGLETDGGLVGCVSSFSGLEMWYGVCVCGL